ncbi:hypothetical protein ZHAS_00018639 [Anopheles sinensis]|uniref:Uncharacterized protein n=1 Tax=Anopheles sinensis TaxID=74873 RepID=A0A084WJH2_ANOSI|nr:hypothetical protein ZHAS_00018639 [Anopheles sinensis]
MRDRHLPYFTPHLASSGSVYEGLRRRTQPPWFEEGGGMVSKAQEVLRDPFSFVCLRDVSLPAPNRNGPLKPTGAFHF